MKTAQIRPYQQRIISKATEAFNNGHARAILVESATGSGKTFIGHSIAKMLQDFDSEIEIGWVAMRTNLLDQAASENAAFGINARMHYISMFQKELPQELLKAKKRAIFIDEAQHDAASSMVEIIEKVRPDYVLGLSATPYRSDNLRLCFDKVIKDSGINALIRDGYLSKFAHYTMNGWSPELVGKSYVKDQARWGKSIIYFHTQDENAKASRYLWAAGVSNAIVTSDNKEEAIEGFLSGKYQVLLNCMILTEGFDCPDLQTVFCRPSCKGVTIQMAGRVLRLHDSLPVKNIVQSDNTKFVFTSHAEPDQSYVIRDGQWASLKPPKELDNIVMNTMRVMSKIEITLPTFMTKKTNKKVTRRAEQEARERETTVFDHGTPVPAFGEVA